MEKRIVRSAELYKTGLNCKQIAKELNISDSTVERDLKKAGIVAEKYTRRRFINHDIDHSFFKSLDNEASMYYLGFIYADGNIYKSKKLNVSWRLNIEIHEKDREILDNFNIRNVINYNSKKNSVRMEVCSNKICEDLQHWGITPKKSLTCKFPDNLPLSLINHFIRGYFDGDGGFSVNNNYLVSYICGTKEFLMKLGEFLPCSWTIHKIGRINSNSYELRTSVNKKEMRKFVDYLYKDAHFFLKRKKNKSFTILP